ncbi:mitochondrial carrier [Ascodesmis nigricans]|uniref:Mitochondrial carrier n=1 Tax=Ascodesmis nigricans TaxID=341454 RepID=A0A4S2MLB7_9PEZI|nr:mitochondrial carrier [Ascodesmis nigricans]
MQDENAEALEWLQRALDFQEKVLGKKHPETELTEHTISLVRAHMQSPNVIRVRRSACPSRSHKDFSATPANHPTNVHQTITTAVAASFSASSPLRCVFAPSSHRFHPHSCGNTMSQSPRLENLFTPRPSSSSNTSAAIPHHDLSTASSIPPPATPPSSAAAMTPTAKPSTRSSSREHESRPPYLHAMMAGGIGGSTGDMLMHSLDTVKTRQQGAPTALKYSTTPTAYATILREEGLFRGLYSGVTPAFLGSFPGTIIFFGTYEYSKRFLIDRGVSPTVSYLTAGLIGDLFASFVYVPSEVLKTRLQLQGRYNNPYFHSGYNYRSTLDAARTIVRVEGFQALFYGYKATLMRDLPFSALQFAFYEYFQKVAKMRAAPGTTDIGVPAEIVTGAMAGMLAGVITCPLDVVKTRLQTAVRTDAAPSVASLSSIPAATSPATTPAVQLQQKRGFHCTATTSVAPGSPDTTRPVRGAVGLQTDSVFRGLLWIYRSEGIKGCFAGVVPRGVWTSVQSGVMLLLYQTLLKSFDNAKKRKEEEKV